MTPSCVFEVVSVRNGLKDRLFLMIYGSPGRFLNEAI